MAKKPKHVAPAGEGNGEVPDWLPTTVLDADGRDTVVDSKEPEPPVSASTTLRMGESYPFPTTTEVRLEDSTLQRLVDRALRPAGGRMISYGEFARGGMGVVERIDDRVLLRQTAVKVLREEYRLDELAARDFVREAQITGQLEHPNIIPIYELSSTPDGRLCFTMKLVEGRTLANLIEELPSGPIERGKLLDLLDVILRVCDALAFAHHRGVVHCDVKPGNVMVADYGQVYLMDWGIAQLVEAHPEPKARPVSCSIGPGIGDPIRGTPSCMAPEQAMGLAVDQRTDVFAVGVLLYAILCRRPPYPVAQPERALHKARVCDFQLPSEIAPGVPPELNRIVLKAMELEPDHRFQSVVELQRDLVRFVRGGTDFPRVRVQAGASIVREGEVGDAAYIIERGRCAVFKQIEGKQVRLREMGAGEVFGELSILAASPRTATVVALEPVVLLKVTREVLEQEVGAMKPWMSAFIRTLAQRFREREGRG